MSSGDHEGMRPEEAESQTQERGKSWIDRFSILKTSYLLSPAILASGALILKDALAFQDSGGEVLGAGLVVTGIAGVAQGLLNYKLKERISSEEEEKDGGN